MKNALLAIIVALSLIGCGGGGGSSAPATPVNVTVTCPNGSRQTATTTDAANSLCPAPALVSIVPANAATGISVDTFTSVDITTDSVLDASTITTANITLKAGTTNVAGAVTVVGSKGFKFTPSTKLNYAQTYTFSASVKDTLGKALLVSSTFTTASIACTLPQIPNSDGGTCVLPPLFSASPILLPDLRKKYDLLCGDDVSAQNAIPVNLSGHKDGKKDLIFNLWCGQLPYGSVANGPTINGTVAFIQQVDGSFLDKTKEIFGVEMVDLIGVGNQAVVHDFNNDGYEDVVFAVTGEDHRYEPAGYTGNNRQNVFITSLGNGSYKVERLGNFSYNHHIQLKDNEFGGKDVVTENIGYGGGRSAWRYTNGWNEINGYDWANFVAVFFNRIKTNVGTSIAITQSTTIGGLDLFTSVGGDSWVKKSTWNFPNISTVPLISDQGSQGTVTIGNFDGKDYESIVFELGCELKKLPTSDSIALMALSTYEIVGGYKGGAIYVTSTQRTEVKPITKLMGFTVANNTIQNAVLKINNEQSDTSLLQLNCGDVNGDGYDDVTILPWGVTARPMVYLNNGFGDFNLVDYTKFPSPPLDYRSGAIIYADIDGDGINDLLQWALTGVTNKPQPVQYKLYKGKRTIQQFDIIK